MNRILLAVLLATVPSFAYAKCGLLHRHCRNHGGSCQSCQPSGEQPPTQDDSLLSQGSRRRGKFETFKDVNGEWRFRLKAGNGEIIFQSEGYKNKQDCNHTIGVIKLLAPDAPVVQGK